MVTQKLPKKLQFPGKIRDARDQDSQELSPLKIDFHKLIRIYCRSSEKFEHISSERRFPR